MMTWFHDFLEVFSVTHEYFGNKTGKPFVVFMKLGKKSLNLVGFGVGIHETREKKIETWRVLVVFMKRWRPVDRRLGPPPLHETTKTLQVSTYFLSSFMNTNTKTHQV